MAIKAGIEIMEFWRKHIEDCNKSGLTRKEYCKEHDLKEHRIYYWLKRFKNENNKNLNKKEKKFFPVAIKENFSKSEIKIKLPNGIVNRFQHPFS